MLNEMHSWLTKIYAYKFFDDFILIYAFYAVMFADFNISPSQIGILLGIWSAVAFLLEVPSGVFADKYSRKHILFIAQLIRGLGYLTWILFPTFWGFLAGFIFWGIKSAFTSGTFEALLYDLLSEEGRKEEYTKILGRAKAFANIGNLLAAGVAALAIQYGYNVVLIVSIVSVLISSISILSLPRTSIKKSTEESTYFHVLRTGLRTIVARPIFIYLISFLVFTYGLGGALDEYWTLFAQYVGSPYYAIAIFISFMYGAEILASFWAHKLEKLHVITMYSLFVFMGILLFAAAHFLNTFSLALLVLYSGLSTGLIILYEGKLQHQIPDNIRATISSVNGLFVEIMALLVYISFGFLSDLYSYQTAFTIFGYVTVFIGMAYILRHMLLGKVGQTSDLLSDT